MAERTTITQVIQLGVEVTPGTAVLATRRLQSISIDPGVKVNVNAFRPQWDKYSTTLALGREWTEATVSGDPNFNELPYILNSLLTTATPVNGSGGAAGSYTWTFQPLASAPDNPTTFTVEHGSSVRADRFSNGIFTALNFVADRTKFTLTGSMIGQQLQDGFSITAQVKDVKNIHASAILTAGSYTVGDGTNVTGAIAYNATLATVQAALLAATPNPIAYTVTGGILTTPTDFVATANTPGAMPGWVITPTGITGGTVSIVQGAVGAGPNTVPLVPAIPPNVDVYYSSTIGGLGGSPQKLLRALSFTFNLDSRFGPLWALNSANSSWATTVETVPKADLKVMVEADAAGMAMLADLRSSATKYIRFNVGGPQIGSTGVNYQFTVDLAVKVKDIAPFRDDQGVYAVEFSFEIVDDATFGGPMKMTIVNALAAL